LRDSPAHPRRLRVQTKNLLRSHVAAAALVIPVDGEATDTGAYVMASTHSKRCSAADEIVDGLPAVLAALASRSRELLQASALPLQPDHRHRRSQASAGTMPATAVPCICGRHPSFTEFSQN